MGTNIIVKIILCSYSLNPKVPFNKQQQQTQLIYVLKYLPELGLTAGMKRETTSITFTEYMITLKRKVKHRLNNNDVCVCVCACVCGVCACWDWNLNL